MNDEILKRLEKRLDRRSFLRGSSLAAAALLGVAAASPLVAFAQTQDRQQADKKGDERDKKDEPKDKEKDGESDEPAKVAKVDADGNEYRECPQCGSNMYRQGRTWTCENCGYSYVE
jgi:ribosomal protein S27AE